MADAYPSWYDDFDGSLRDVNRNHYLMVDELYFMLTVTVETEPNRGLLHVDYWVDKNGNVLDETQLPKEHLELYGY